VSRLTTFLAEPITAGQLLDLLLLVQPGTAVGLRGYSQPGGVTQLWSPARFRSGCPDRWVRGGNARARSRRAEGVSDLEPACSQSRPRTTSITSRGKRVPSRRRSGHRCYLLVEPLAQEREAGIEPEWGDDEHDPGNDLDVHADVGSRRPERASSDNTAPGPRSASPRRTDRDCANGHQGPLRSPSSPSTPVPRLRRSPVSTPGCHRPAREAATIARSRCRARSPADHRKVTDRIAIAENRVPEAEANGETGGGSSDPASISADPAQCQPLGHPDHQACHRTS
jgi:hypothetical protein